MENTNSSTTDQNNSTTQTTTAPTEHEKEKERLLTENANLRKAQKDSDAKLAQLSDEVSNLKKAGHASTGDWKKLSEQHEAEAKTWKEKFENTNRAFVGTLQGAKLKEEALKQGLKPDLVDLVDSMEFDEISTVIDENNRFNVKGVEEAVGNLKKLRPSLFQDKAAPAFNAGSGNLGSGSATGGKLTVAEAKKNYAAAYANRGKDPAALQKAHLDLQKAANEARKAGK